MHAFVQVGPKIKKGAQSMIKGVTILTDILYVLVIKHCCSKANKTTNGKEVMTEEMKESKSERRIERGRKVGFHRHYKPLTFRLQSVFQASSFVIHSHTILPKQRKTSAITSECKHTNCNLHLELTFIQVYSLLLFSFSGRL